MNYEQSYRRLISGQSGGLTGAPLRLVLSVVSWFYSGVVLLRNFLYSKGWLKTYRANATVISIGNITTGGTGKTPLVIWLYNQITQNYSCAILTRGYKTTKNYIDEPAVLAESCPEARVIVNPDRVAGAAEAVEKFAAKLLVMDDGFQHRRLGRDLDIVAIDATRPFGYGKLLPAGLLREPVTALKRADVVVITRCDQVAESQLSQTEKKLLLINPNMIIAKSMHAAVCAKSTDNKEIALDQLKNKKIFAFCGIGNPAAFLNTIEELGTNLVGSKVYNDHHHYTQDDITHISEKAGYLNADLILTTHKDWTKITPLMPIKKDILFACLVVALAFLAGEEKLKGLIKQALAGKILQK